MRIPDGARPPRRRVLEAISGALGVAALPGCARVSTRSATRPLQVWGGVPEQDGPGEVIRAFERRHGSGTVQYTRFVNDERGNLKLDTALQGGVDIDVYFTYSPDDMALRAGSGMAADLRPLVRQTPEFASFEDTTAPRAYFDGAAITALATTKEPNLVLFNDKLRQGNDLPLPRSWTVRDFIRSARALSTAQRPGAYLLPNLPQIVFGPNHRYDSRGDSNFDDPLFVRYFRLVRDLIEQGVLFSWTEVLGRQLDAYQQNAFLDEEFAIWVTAPFSLRYLQDSANYPHDFRVSCAPMPTMSEGSWNTGVFGNFIMINPKSPRQELAQEFVRFWILEGSEAMAKGGKIPVLGNVPEDRMIRALLGPDSERYFDVDSFRRVLFDQDPRLFVDTELTATPEITHAFEQQRDLCWLGERSAEDAVAAVHARAQAAIERYRQRG